MKKEENKKNPSQPGTSANARVSPYFPDMQITDPTKLFGRPELEQLIQHARSHMNTQIVGHRSFGKSSLLGCLNTRLLTQPRESELVVYTSVIANAGVLGRPYDFYLLLLENLNTQFSRIDLASTIELNKTLGLDDRPFARFRWRDYSEPVIDELFSAYCSQLHHRGITVILLLDEIGAVKTRFHPGEKDVVLYNRLREEVKCGRLTVIYTDRHRWSDITPPSIPNSAGLNFTNREVTLGLLKAEDSRSLILKLNNEFSRPVTYNTDEVNWIIDLSGGHPYLLQLLAQIIYLRKISNEPKSIPELTHETLIDVEGHFMQYWQSVTSIERKVMVEICENGEISRPAENVIANELISWGLLVSFSEPVRYRLFSPLFKEFIHKHTRLEGL